MFLFSEKTTKKVVKEIFSINYPSVKYFEYWTSAIEDHITNGNSLMLLGRKV